MARQHKNMENMYVYAYINLHTYTHTHTKGLLVCSFLLWTLWKRQNYRHFCIVVALKTQNLKQVNPFQNCEIVMCVNGNCKVWAIPNPQRTKLLMKPPPHIKIDINTAERMHALAAGLLCKKKPKNQIKTWSLFLGLLLIWNTSFSYRHRFFPNRKRH